MWVCSDCGVSGKAGNHIRTYTITSPVAEFDLRLCWNCYLKQDKKNKSRPHVHIRDRVSI